MNTTQVDSYSAAYAQSVQKAEQSAAQSTGSTAKSGNYGKTIGEPKLSDEAAKYYEELKNKYGDMDFILVSKDMKEMAKSMAGSFANPNKLVVLIDEEKLERMATDEEFRQKYENIIANAKSGLSQLKQSIGSNTQVKGYGMLFNDGGTASFFAVVDKSLAAQRKRIEQKAADKKEAAKQEAKKEAQEKQEERIRERRNKNTTDETDADAWDEYGIRMDDRYEMITASSVEELEKKLNDYFYEERSNQVWTEQEKMLGQNVDFRL